jgi:hypothetical protein
VQELRHIGCTLPEVADILREQTMDAPWIIFTPQRDKGVGIITLILLPTPTFRDAVIKVLSTQEPRFDTPASQYE